MERVLANLVVNAAKYSPQSSEITIRVRQEDGWAVVSVEDRGIGIAKEDAERIFDSFYRSANAIGHSAGRGIGLAGARRIVEQRGGAICVESQEGVGSVFTVRLPLTLPPSE